MNDRSFRKNFAVGVLLAILSTTSFSLAHAKVGRDLIAEGVQARRDGKDQEALGLFEEALRLHPTPQANAQLGLCEQALGLWVQAETHLEEGLKGADDPWIKKHQATLQSSLEVVQRKIGTVEIWGTPAGASTIVDGTAAGKLPLPHALHFAEGRHAITIQAPGYIAEDRVLIVRPGTLSREHVALAPTTPPAPAAGTASTDEPKVPSPSARQSEESEESAATVTPSLPTWRRVLPWTLAVGAVAAGAFGAWEHVNWNRNVDRFDAIPACGASAPMRGVDPSCAGIYRDLSTAKLGTIVGYGMAGVLAAGAATLFILNTGKSTDGGETTVGIQLGSDRTWLFCSARLTL